MTGLGSYFLLKSPFGPTCGCHKSEKNKKFGSTCGCRKWNKKEKNEANCGCRKSTKMWKKGKLNKVRHPQIQD